MRRKQAPPPLLQTSSRVPVDAKPLVYFALAHLDVNKSLQRDGAAAVPHQPLQLGELIVNGQVLKRWPAL